MEFGIRGLALLIVNLIAVFTYLDYRRADVRGFRRFLAFWIGFPWTLGVLLGVRPDPDLVLARRIEETLPSEEEDVGVPPYVREEVRRARERRGLAAPEGEEPEGQPKK